MWIEVFLMIVFVKCCFGLDGMFRWFWKEGLGVVIKKYVRFLEDFLLYLENIVKGVSIGDDCVFLGWRS